MSYVITGLCVSKCNTQCVKVCPMDCIHGPIPVETLENEIESKRGVQLYIDPELCIDCGACESECPENAIFADDELPEKWLHSLEENAQFFQKS